MDIRKLIRSGKTIRHAGQWAVGTMPRTAFPLSKSGGKAYRLGNRHWRVVTFDACGLSCRLLINYHPTLFQYQAMLGVESGGDTKVIVSLEYHPTHKPWHAHVCCDDIAFVPAGIKRGPWFKDLHGVGTRHQLPCPGSDEAAFQRAASFFRLDLREERGLA